MHVNGRATRSCITPVSSISGQPALPPSKAWHSEGDHPLQQAWVKTQAPQCGYCQSGQIMQAAAMLQDFPDPDDEQYRLRDEWQPVPLHGLCTHTRSH